VHVDYAEGAGHCAFLAADALSDIYFGDAGDRVHDACAGRAHCRAGCVSAHVAADDKGFPESLVSHDGNTGNHFPALAIMIERTAYDATSASSTFFLVVYQGFSVTHNYSPFSKTVTDVG
jgi:hypothetical protein